jgi:hypothetical protein
VNIIDQQLEELKMREMHVRFERGQFHVFVERSGGNHDVEADGETLEEAVRHALENARLGNTTRNIPQRGQRIYTVSINQEYTDAKGVHAHIHINTLTRIIAKDDAAAQALAHLAFGDQPGFLNLEVTFCELV